MIYNPVEIRLYLNYIRACEEENFPHKYWISGREGGAVGTNLGVFGKRLQVFGELTEVINMPMIVYTRRGI